MANNAKTKYYGEPDGCNSPIYGEHPKSSPVGDAAKMREVLMWLDSVLEDGVERCEVARALAEPARECDRFDDELQADDLLAAFLKYCNDCDCPMGCIHRREMKGLLDVRCASILKCFARFALSKADNGKGESDGSK